MKNKNYKDLNGMQIYILVWFGQLISIMGSAMTKFALLIWAFEKVSKASTTALLGFCATIPVVVFSPIAGAIVDKFDKKKIMIVCNLGSAIVSIIIFLLYTQLKLRVYHIYIAEVIYATFGTFQYPAFSSSISILIPKEKYSQASGMQSFSNWSSQIFAPILGGLVMATLGIKGIMQIDIISFFFALVSLLIVKMPSIKVDKEQHKNVRESIKFGIAYIFEREGLFLLLMLFLIINFLAGLTYFGILPAMILSRTGNNNMVLAGIQSALGIGGIAGSLIVSIWGLPKKKVHTILITCGLSFLLGDMLLGIHFNIFIWYIGAFISSFFIPFLIGGEQYLWQAKVEPYIQGRVFAIKGMMQMSASPIGYILGGVLADYVFEPAMNGKTFLNSLFAWLVGSGNGAGMGLMFIFSGLIGTAVCFGCFSLKKLVNLENEIEDCVIE